MPDEADANRLAALPSVDRLLRSDGALRLLEEHARPAVASALRQALEVVRSELKASNGKGWRVPDEETLVAEASTLLERRAKGSLRRAINVTGVVLHTGLGRAVLAREAAAAVAAVAEGHSTLELDLESGERGSRQSHVEGALCGLTGAEAALAVNNNAAAVFLALSALARDAEVVVSRGQLVEIGGSFRVPDILQAGGARLVEVGTTNRTRIGDYRAAVTERTALLLLVHPSNYRVVGFTASPTVREVADLGRELGIPVMEDLGSGALVDLSAHGLAPEPVVRDSVEAGADLVCFSGDKLLGGPQAGLMVGRRELVRRCAAHPLARAVRCDKMTLAALAATLRLYEDGTATERVPTLAALLRRPDDLLRQARRLASALRRQGWSVQVVPGASQVGGGSLPGEDLPTTLVSLDPAPLSAEDLARRLRLGNPPVLCRLHKERVLLDPRTLPREEERHLLAAFR
ncbi:MAG TPA: L-seryl-tRNA(Sec) selenium transferase [Armatimonadota bacterium]